MLISLLGFVFAFKVLPVIIFFSSLVSVLYYLRVMPVLVQIIGGGISRLLGGSFIGQKLVINEFVAYIEFGAIQETLSSRSRAIITFALCGFANFASIAILLGGLGSLVPERRSEIAQLGLKAVLAGTLANLSGAAIAGMLITN